MLIVCTLVAGGAGCSRRSAEDVAAERAQDACIGALAPVARSHAPSVTVLDRAVADARAAARADPARWRTLEVRLEGLAARRGTSDFEPAVALLVAECKRVNEVVRSGGEEPPAA